jgi:hypothetical protein
MSIEFSADVDLSKVRAAIDKLESDVKSKPIVVSTTAAGTGTVNPPGTIATPGSNAPTAQQVLGTVYVGGQPVNITNPSIAASLAAQGVAGFQSAPAAAGAAAMAQVVPAASPTNPAPVGSPVAVAMQMSPGYRSGAWGRSGYGVGGLIGIGTAANILSQGFTAERQYNIASTLAGTNERGQLDAMLAYRDSIASSGGFIGRGVAYLQDPSGMGEAGIRATLRSSELGDARMGRVRDVAERSTLLREQADVLSESNPYNRRLRQIDADFDRSKRSIKNQKREFMDKEREQVLADVIDEVTADNSAVVARFKKDNPNVTPSQQNAALDRARNDVVGEEVSRRMSEREKKYDARYFNPDLAALGATNVYQRRDIDREEGFRRRSAIAGYGFSAEATFYGAMGDPRGVRRVVEARDRYRAFTEAGRDQRGFGEWAAMFGAEAAGAFGEMIGERRDDYFEADDAKRSAQVSRDLINRQPLQARLDELERSRQRAIYQKSSTAAEAINQDFAARADVIKLQDSDTKRYLGMALSAEGRELAFAADYQPLAGSAARSSDMAILDSKRLLEQQGDQVNAQKVLDNAILDQQARARSYLNSFEAEQFDPMHRAINSPRSGEDAVKYLAQIASDIAAIKAAGGTATTD